MDGVLRHRDKIANPSCPPAAFTVKALLHPHFMADDISPLLSVGQIAVLINRSAMTVHRRILAKGIQPALRLSVGGARYDPSVVEQLRPLKHQWRVADRVANRLV